MDAMNSKEVNNAIEKMTETIVQKFHPNMIILFGSYANGSYSSDSDVDLLVVMDVKGSKRHTAVDIDLALSDRTLPLDLIVVTPEEFERYRDISWHIINPAVREGKILYERAA